MDRRLAPPAPGPRRSPARRRRARVPLALFASPLFALGCTTLPFSPQSGPGAAFTLVTVENVEARERALRADLSTELADQVADSVRAAREADRARLEDFALRIEEHAEEMEKLAAQLEQNAETTLELARVVSERLDALVAESNAILDQARQLELEIGVLPYETLDRLRRAIGEHLDSQAAVTPTRRLAPAPAPVLPTAPPPRPAPESKTVPAVAEGAPRPVS